MDEAKHREWTIEIKEAKGSYVTGFWFELTNCTEKIISGGTTYDTSEEALKEARNRIDKEIHERNIKAETGGLV